MTSQLPNPLLARIMEGAVQKPITREMLSGDWQEVIPAQVAGSSVSNHFDRLWVTNTPGATLTFKFAGTTSNHQQNDLGVCVPAS